MEKNINYKELYLLQDEILEIIIKLENNFYLTGGTALHRFYYDARYSDDLDFFRNE
ncbi:MAG: nucleotidyl transferase AbiEii/AbiGii toxin family protein [Sulfurimonas sp.]|nr:nucleotidyl transferase AbiEii/AbiGii toxin family protein [Sulfurimonas sp.]